MKRQDLIDYMLFATNYKMLALCLQDKNKFRGLWNNVIRNQGFSETEEELLHLPEKSEMESSNYVSAYKKAINYRK